MKKNKLKKYKNFPPNEMVQLSKELSLIDKLEHTFADHEHYNGDNDEYSCFIEILQKNTLEGLFIPIGIQFYSSKEAIAFVQGYAHLYDPLKSAKYSISQFQKEVAILKSEIDTLREPKKEPS